MPQISSDPRANPSEKYKRLDFALVWTANVGFPGYATAPICEVLDTFVLPTMFAKVARNEMSPEDAAQAAEKEIKRIFAKWK